MDMLFVMCPQNSFLSSAGSLYMGEKAEDLKIRLKDYVGGYTGKKVFFKEKHAHDDSYFSRDRTHSIATTEDYKIEPSLQTYANLIYDKTRYSAFHNTGLEQFLIREKIQEVGIVGLETHTSILFTAEELINRGISVIIIEPCTMARDEHMHNFAISLMSNFLGVHISNG